VGHQEIRPATLYKRPDAVLPGNPDDGADPPAPVWASGAGRGRADRGHGDVERQTVQILDNVKTLVEAAGGTLGDVARIVVYLTSRDHLPTVLAVRRRYFREPYPASTAVVVVGLARPDWLVEIEATAVLP
jgi:enamine deaminase RidA (YjgF/YER057c/UK114 family)